MKAESEAPGKDGGVPEALVMLCLLSAVGLVLLLAWLSGDLWHQSSFSSRNAESPGKAFIAVVSLGVLLLDFVLLILLFRRPRLAASCRLFGVGILVGLISMAVTAFVVRAHIGKSASTLVLTDPLGELSVAFLLLVLGTMGVLLVTMGLLLRRGDATPQAGLPGEIAFLLLGVAALLLFAYETAWRIYTGFWTDGFPTDLLRAAPAKFIVVSAGAAAALLAAIVFVPRSRTTRPRHLLSLPLGTVLVAVLMVTASWVISRAMVGSSQARPPVGLTLEFLRSLFLSSADAPRGLVDWGRVRGIGLILVGVIEVVFRLLGRGGPDPRPTLVLRWFSGVLAGGLLLLAAAALSEMVEVVHRHRENAVDPDFVLLFEACAGVASLLPVYLFATLLAATRPFQSGRVYRLLHRTGLALLALGVVACVTWTAMWWSVLEWEATVSPYRHLLAGARYLKWGAVAFVGAVTVAMVVEFVRFRHLTEGDRRRD